MDFKEVFLSKEALNSYRCAKTTSELIINEKQYSRFISKGLYLTDVFEKEAPKSYTKKFSSISFRFFLLSAFLENYNLFGNSIEASMLESIEYVLQNEKFKEWYSKKGEFDRLSCFIKNNPNFVPPRAFGIPTLSELTDVRNYHLISAIEYYYKFKNSYFVENKYNIAYLTSFQNYIYEYLVCGVFPCIAKNIGANVSKTIRYSHIY